MRFFWIKFALFCLSVILAIAGLIFILNLHADNLMAGAPASAESYFHGNSKFISALPAKQSDFIFNWLTASSSLTQDQWRNAIINSQPEIAIFTINRQPFGLIKNTSQNKNVLMTNKILFAESNNFIYFPKLNLKALNFSGKTWISEMQIKFNTAKAVIYLKNISSLNIPLSAMPADQTSPITALIYLSKQGVKINAFGQIGQNNVTRFKPNITKLPSNSTIYFHGLTPSAINQKAPYSVKNFSFLLLRSINGPVEYLNFSDKFIIYALKKENNIENIKKNIIEILANMAPRQQVKILPDETTSIQLIADTKKWTFETTLINQHEYLTIQEPKINIALKITDTDKFYIISNNLSDLNIQPNEKNQIITELFDFCAKFNKKNLIYINPISFNLEKYINHVVITSQNPNKISICLH